MAEMVDQESWFSLGSTTFGNGSDHQYVFLLIYNYIGIYFNAYPFSSTNKI